MDEGNSYYFAQDGVLLTKNYDNNSQELRSYTLISYPRGKTDPFTVPEKAGEILPNAFKEVTGATIYVSRGVDNYVVDKLQKLGSGFAVVSLGGTVSAASVELRQNDSAVPAGQSFTLNIGGELAFSAAVLPEKASQEVFWTSSDSDVVTVNSSGTVTARSAGTATLTVSTAELVGNQHLSTSAPPAPSPCAPNPPASPSPAATPLSAPATRRPSPPPSRPREPCRM